MDIDMTKEALARAFYAIETARDDTDDLPETDRECMLLHLDEAAHWLQEMEQANGWDLITLIGEYVPAPGARRVALEVMLRKALPEGTVIDVSDWAGHDEDWSDPIYVTAEDPDEEQEYYDAISDLDEGTLEQQAGYILDQLLHG